jgi:glutathione synthase/RimK-type ligase-like ATP-grasp enzyme
MILIIASPHDIHARCVTDRLRAVGQRVCILDLAVFGQGGSVTYPIGRLGSPRVTSTDGQIIEMDEARTVWYRRHHHPQVPAAIVDTDDRRFAQAEWAETLTGLLMSLNARVINPMLPQMAATKPRQLEVARQIGLRVPDTLITNDPAEVERFLELHNAQIIHKAMSAPNHQLIDTRRWTGADRPGLSDLSIAPTMFQEEIIGPADVRVTVVGSQIFTARIVDSHNHGVVDSRMNLEMMYEPHELPTKVQYLIMEFMKKTGLVVGAIDMKITADGDYVFFEVNPQGQFLYIEILTGLPITSAFARLLAEN